MATIGVLTGRVLGVRIGWLRSAGAAAIGWAAGLTAAGVLLGPHNSHALLVIPLSIFFGVLAALPVAIILDLVSRSRPKGRRRRSPLRHPVKATRAVLTPLGRFRELVANARHENLLHVRYRTATALESADLARRVRLVLERSGGMFVKFGQIAATRSDLLPETFTTELSKLHASVAPMTPEQVSEVVREELGEAPEKAFAAFTPEPLAAASIGQAHRATLHDGRSVIVKVQRQGLDDIVRRDSAVLSFVAAELDRRVEAARRVGARDLAEELITSIEAELDYGREVTAATRLRESRGADTGIRIPIVYPELSTDRLLVMDEITGRPVSDTDAIKAVPVPPAELCRRLLDTFLKQIIQDGYYHADPHPGNVLIDAEGSLWLLDFGAVGRIDPVTRDALQGIAIGFSIRDGSVLARAVRYLVGDDELDLTQLERDMSILLGEVQAGGLSPEAMSGMIDVMERHGLRPPRAMMLLSRTLITLEGTLKTIDPSFELSAAAGELVTEKREEVLGTPEEMIRAEVVHALPALRTLPGAAEALADQLRGGRLVVRTERYAGADRQIVDAWLNRLLVGIAGAAGAVSSGIVLAAGSMASDIDVRDGLWIIGFSGLTCATVLLMRTVAQALQTQRGTPD
jgi:ubiquinone biosynthesis protein